MKYRKFKLSNGEIIETPYYMEKAKYGSTLWNRNVKREEGIDGDEVETRDFKGTVRGYTNYQIIPLKEHGQIHVMETNKADGNYLKFKHNTTIVEEIDNPTVYISGPMTGLSEDEYKANFQSAYNALKDRGFLPCNPSDNSVNDSDMTYNDILMFDLDTLSNYDAIYMLKGYEKSKGAMAELYVANALGLEVMYENGATIFPLYGAK